MNIMRSRWRDVTIAVVLAVSSAAQADETSVLEQMVKQDCGSCHGLTLKGGLGRPLTPDALASLDPQAISSIILDGIPGTAMPPWRPLLSEQQAKWIADYLKSRSP